MNTTLNTINISHIRILYSSLYIDCLRSDVAVECMFGGLCVCGSIWRFAGHYRSVYDVDPL